MAGTGGGTLSLSLITNSFDAHFVFHLKRKFLWLFSLLGKRRKAWKTPEAVNKLEMLSRDICNGPGTVPGGGEAVGGKKESSLHRGALSPDGSTPVHKQTLKREVGKVL